MQTIYRIGSAADTDIPLTTSNLPILLTSDADTQYLCRSFTSDSDSDSSRIQVRYRKDPHMQNSMRKLKLTLTLSLTDTGGAVLTLIARIQKFTHYMAIVATCDSGPL